MSLYKMGEGQNALFFPSNSDKPELKIYIWKAWHPEAAAKAKVTAIKVSTTDQEDKQDEQEE